MLKSPNKKTTKSIAKQVKPKALNISNKQTDTDWAYDGDSGPQAWAKAFPNANLNHQSPINIDNKAAVFDPNLLFNPFLMRYDLDCCSMLRNTGHTFEIDTYPAHKTGMN